MTTWVSLHEWFVRNIINYSKSARKVQDSTCTLPLDLLAALGQTINNTSQVFLTRGKVRNIHETRTFGQGAGEYGVWHAQGSESAGEARAGCCGRRSRNRSWHARRSRRAGNYRGRRADQFQALGVRPAEQTPWGSFRY